MPRREGGRGRGKRQGGEGGRRGREEKEEGEEGRRGRKERKESHYNIQNCFERNKLPKNVVCVHVHKLHTAGGTGVLFLQVRW